MAQKGTHRVNILGHAGLTLATACTAGYLSNALSARRHWAESRQAEAAAGQVGLVGSAPGIAVPPTMDYRMVLLGSLFPDIVDKALAFWLLPEVVNYNTRGVGHTLAFHLGLLVIAFLLLQLTRSYRPLIFAMASMGHLLLDHIWQAPRILWWPFYGWRLPPGTTTLDEWFRYHSSVSRWVTLPEVVGGLVLIWFAIQLYRHRAVLQFLRMGTIA
jgi:hypothetical protein